MVHEFDNPDRTIYFTRDEAGRMYSVCLSREGNILYVSRKVGGRKTGYDIFLDPWGKKAARLSEQVRKENGL